jgi:DUF438 domain-containing protein
MSELINNSNKRKEMLKHVILQIHQGEAPEFLRGRLKELMAQVPYGEVVEVEQELIAEGLPQEEVIKLCDVHSEVLNGFIDLSSKKEVAPGHPVDTFSKENEELTNMVDSLNAMFARAGSIDSADMPKFIIGLKAAFNALMDVDKHYQRKENLLFPFLEKNNITGPPKVMWAKHDETRDLLKNAITVLDTTIEYSNDDIEGVIDFVLRPAAKAVTDMIMKEEEILFPMSLDKLTDVDWYEIYSQTNEIGYCLYDPQVEWKPEGIDIKDETSSDENLIKLPSGSFSAAELLAILNTLPIDMTFVDKNDKVRYFSQGSERIFSRNRAILQRDVRMCHPPSSVNIVDKILEDFRSGKEDRAPFWINMGGKFIHIEYFALRDEKGEYLGTLEVSQDLSGKRALEGEQRLLSYDTKNEKKD